jgi:hypothetical protein
MVNGTGSRAMSPEGRLREFGIELPAAPSAEAEELASFSLSSYAPIFMSPLTFCVFALKDDSHPPSVNATLRMFRRRNRCRNKRRITVVRASRKAKGKKTKDEGP